MPQSKTHLHSVLAVGYVRRSTDKQEASLEEQMRTIQEYAEAHGYKIIRWYTDDGISGDDTERRHDFKQMHDDAENRSDFQAVICWDQSRYGRFPTQEAMYWTFRLSKAGVKLITVDKGVIDQGDVSGWVTYGIDQHAKHEFLKQLSKDVVRGQRQAAEQGSWLGSPPYAYRLEGAKKHKRLVVDDLAKVKVVQRIFREFVDDGRSMSDIAKRLQTEGFVAPCSRGQPWRFSTVRVILENPAYVGDYASRRYTYGTYNSMTGKKVKKKGARIKNAQTEWSVRRDNHESIIDRETFDKAQAILAKGKTGRSNHYSPEEHPFLLAGLLRCGKCGGPMWGDRNPRKNGSALTYECGNMFYNGVSHCQGTTVKERDILAGVADHLDSELFAIDSYRMGELASKGELTADDLPEAFARVREMVAPPTPKQPALNRRSIEAQIRKLDEAITKARTNLVLLDADNIPAAQTEIKRMAGEREGLEAELKKKPPTESDLNAQGLQVLQALWWLRHLFRSAVQEAQYNTPEAHTELAQEIREQYPDARPAFMEGAAKHPALKKYLKHVVKIDCHTEKSGKGTGTRYRFLGGEIAFRVVGAIAKESNPRFVVVIHAS